MNHKLAAPPMTLLEAAWLDQCLERGKSEMFHQIVDITPGIAGALMERNNHNRPYSIKGSEKWANIMKEGRWIMTPESIMVDSNGVLQDGQHRLGGLILANVPVNMMIWFGTDPENFKVLNTGRGRTTGHIAAMAGYSNAVARAAVAGHITRMEGPSKADSNKVFNKVEEVAGGDMDEALKFGSYAKNYNICNQSAAALAYWYIVNNTKNIELFEDFKKGFLTGANLPEKSPILRLRKIINTAIQGANSNQKVFKQAAAIVLCWNCFVQGKHLNSVSWDQASKLPVCM